MGDNMAEFPIKLLRGRPPKHGGYSVIHSSALPRNRRRLLRYLMTVRAGLIEDLGPTEADLSTAQKILIDRVVQKLGFMRCIEEWAAEKGIFENGQLKSPFSDHYLAYSNSIRLDLQALGIKPPKKEIIDLGEYIERKEKAQAKGQDKSNKESKNGK